MRGFCAKDLRSPPGALRHIRGNAVTPTADRIEEATTPAVGAPGRFEARLGEVACGAHLSLPKRRFTRR